MFFSNMSKLVCSTYYGLVLPFGTLWKYQKTTDFQMFSGGIQRSTRRNAQIHFVVEEKCKDDPEPFMEDAIELIL